MHIFSKIKFTLLVLVYFSIGCSQREDNSLNEKTGIKSKTKVENHVVLILHNINYTGWFTEDGGKRSRNDNVKGVISYIDTLHIKQQFMPTGGTDTLIIPTKGRKYIDVSYHYKVMEDVYFLLKNGDTLDINLNELQYPTLSSRVYPSTNYLINFRGQIANRVSKRSPYGFETSTLLRDDFNSAKFYLKKESEEKFDNVFSEDETSIINVDSLKEDYRLYKEEVRFSLTNLRNKNEKNEISEKDIIIYSNYFEKEFDGRDQLIELVDAIWDKSKEKNEMDNSEYYNNRLNDELVGLTLYNDFINSYQYFESQKKNVPLIRFKQGSTFDPRVIFDNIAENEIIPPKSKKLLLRKNIGIMIDNNLEGLLKYITHYNEITKDFDYSDFLNKKYNLNYSSDKLFLESVSGDLLTLEEVIETQKGKKVLIDFWATWCAPCIKEIPFVNKYQLDNKENLQVIALSIDEDKEHWKNNDHVKSSAIPQYRIVNKHTSSRYRDYQVETIPRYLLFDQSGYIADLDFPRPSSF